MNHEWRRFALLFGASLAVCVPVLVFLPVYRDLILLYLYSIPSNSVIPVPHEPAMIYFGRHHPPMLVAVVAAIGTMVPCFVDYQAITFAFHARRLKRARDSDFYQGAVSYFLKAPFLSIMIAAFAPFIPFYVFRVLSPSSGYPLRRYMLAVALGRLPRYYLFALMGRALTFPGIVRVGALIVTGCTVIFILLKRHLSSGRDLSEPSPPVSVPASALADAPASPLAAP